MGVPETMPVGMTIASDIELTQSAKNAYIARNVDKDITAAQAPLLVSVYRAQLLKVAGVSSWSGTVAGNVITFAADADKMIAAVIEEAKVANWFFTGQLSTAPATPKYDFAGEQITLTILGVDYVISGASSGGRTITTVTNPPAGVQTVNLHPYRVAGAASTARLRRRDGLALVGAGDVDGEVVGGFRKMDRVHNHWHQNYQITTSGAGATGYANENKNVAVSLSASSAAQARELISDGTNGTPRTGKTTDPRTAGQYIYTFAGILLAAA